MLRAPHVVRTLLRCNGHRGVGVSGNKVVGHYINDTGTHGFLYDGTNYTTIDDPLSDGNTWATGISGTTIVGGYTGATDDTPHGFIATTPEPASIALLSLGGLVLLRRRRNAAGCL